MAVEITDQKERRQAIQPTHSFIIQAPAGSGKTELLIQRYLRLLALVDAPEEIITITFTRKAAAEMQGRIVNALTAAQDNTQRHTGQKLTQKLAIAALQRDTMCNWNVIKNPSRLRIQTIDSLSAGLSRQLPIPSRLGAQLEISDDAHFLYQQAAINTVAELEGEQPHAAAITTLLAHLDNDLPRLQDLTVAMLKKRDQWLRYITRAHNSRPEFERTLKSIIEASLDQLLTLFPASHEAELCELMQYAAQNLENNKNDSYIRHCITMKALPGNKVEDLGKWLGVAELVLTKKDSWRRLFNKKNGFPAKARNNAAHRDIKQRAQHLVNFLEKQEGMQQSLATIRRLPSPAYTDKEWKIVTALCTYLLLAEAQLRLCFAEHRQIDYIGVAQAAIIALGKEDAPTDLALYLDYQIRHLLVDEFQDVSLNQQQLLLALCNGWSANEGRSLFFVGDPMQSIYRFREAEVGIFTSTFQQQRFGQIPLIALKLSSNFRSFAPIIDWINQCFSTIFPAQNAIHTGAVAYTPTLATKAAKTAGVHIYPFFNEADALEANAVLDIIKKIGEQNERIAILVRSRSHVKKLIPLLKNAGITLHAVEMESLGQQPAIQDLMALVRAYIHLADRVAWLAVLRAPWCGLSLQELYIIAHDDTKTVWGLINDDRRQKKLAQHTQIRLKRLINHFNDAFSQQGRQSLRHIIEVLWINLGGPATLTAKNELDQVTLFFELISEFDTGCNIEQPARFTEKVKQLFAAPSCMTEQAIQIMTIHKAKGLEFDHVIIPGLGHAQKKRRNELLIWLTQPHQQHEDSLILAPIKEIGAPGMDNTIYKYIAHTEQQKQIYEETRLLYVAATRAKKSLHLLGHARLKQTSKQKHHCSPVASSLLDYLWPAVKTHFVNALPLQLVSTQKTAAPAKRNQYRRLATTWQIPIPEGGVDYAEKKLFERDNTPQVAIEYEWAGTLIRHVGSVVHRVLQQIAIQGLGQWDTARIQHSTQQFIAMLRQYGVSKAELNEGCNLVCEALHKTLNDARGRWILNEKHKEQHNEYRLSGIYDGKLVHVAIDRSFIDRQQRRWVIDYKTSSHQGEDKAAFLDQEQQRYRHKLTQYGTLIQATGDQPVWLGLYFPLLQGWRAWAL